LPEPATQEPPTLFEQAERLIAKLTLDERRRLIERLLTDVPSSKVEKTPEVLLELTARTVPKKEHHAVVAASGSPRNGAVGACGAEIAQLGAVPGDATARARIKGG
jgi:hypothetical protein